MSLNFNRSCSLGALAALQMILQPSQGVAQTMTEREARIFNQRQQVRAENYDLKLNPLRDDRVAYWQNMLWTTAVTEPREVFVAEAIASILSLAGTPSLTPAQRRIVDVAMQVGTQLYVKDPSFYAAIGQRFSQAIATGTNATWVSMSLSALARAGVAPADLKPFVDLTMRRFPAWTSNAVLYPTVREIVEGFSPATLPPLEDLLNWTIAPNQPQLYVLCQRDRKALCTAVLKDRNGQFIGQNGQPWAVPLLLESVHRLSWNFNRGQTPQGVFRIEGVTPQPDNAFFRAYGQFPLVNLFLPFEPGVSEFLPGRKGAFTGSLRDYQTLLPPNWREYFPMQQSFWAGKSGRGLLRIHGSGEYPDFFRGKEPERSSYAWNPTIGCLSALEQYDDRGNLLRADMPKILQALQTAGGGNLSGYAIVVEVPETQLANLTLPSVAASAARPRECEMRTADGRIVRSALLCNSANTGQPSIGQSSNIGQSANFGQSPIAPKTSDNE